MQHCPSIDWLPVFTNHSKSRRRSASRSLCVQSVRVRETISKLMTNSSPLSARPRCSISLSAKNKFWRWSSSVKSLAYMILVGTAGYVMSRELWRSEGGNSVLASIWRPLRVLVAQINKREVWCLMSGDTTHTRDSSEACCGPPRAISTSSSRMNAETVRARRRVAE